MIEHVLAIGMPLAVTGQRGDQPIPFDVQQMLGLPAGMRADAATVFQGTEERMAQKWLMLRYECIPGVRCYFGQIFQTLQRHQLPLHFL
ncbi:hypothetical protein D3C85_1212950 [compost metagenome]